MNHRARFFVILLVGALILLSFSVAAALRSLGAVLPLEPVRTIFLSIAWMPTFFDYLIVVVVSAALITFSLALSSYDLGGSGRLIEAARPVLVTIIVLGIVHGFWIALAGPAVDLRIQQIAYRSRVARFALDTVEQSQAVGNYDEALEHALLYRSIFGDDYDLEATIRVLQAAIDERAREIRFAARPPVPDDLPRAAEQEELTIVDLINSARMFLERGNYYSAHYYATIAVQQSGDTRADARRVQSEALRAIEGESWRIEEESQRTLYRDKLNAYQLLVRGERDPRALVDAYYLFQELAARAPDDPDVRRYSAVAEERVAAISFFVEEARTFRALPGRNELIFFNRRSDEMSELIVVDTIVQAPSGDFFYGIEVFRRELDRTVHFRIPYGKRIGSTLVLRALRQGGMPSDGAANMVLPHYLSGAPVDDAFGEVIPLQLDVPEILRTSGGQRAMSTFSLEELIRIPRALSALGQPVRYATIELALRFVRIMGFFVVSVYAVALGWRHRSLYIGSPPLTVFALLPILPVAVWWTVDVTRSVLLAAVTTISAHADPSTVFIGTVSVLSAAVVGSFVSLARQSVAP